MATATRRSVPIPVALALTAAGTLLILLVPVGFVPPGWVIAALTAFAMWRRPALRETWDPRVWKQERSVLAVMAATIVIAAVALTVWAAFQPRTGLGAEAALGDPSPLDEAIDRARAIPLWIFPLAAVLFALVNATAEEFVYRGVVLRSLLPLGATAAVLAQAAAFGIIHLNGFPSGWWGVAMAFVYGVVLGWLRVRTAGLAAPVAVHLVADVVIAFLVRFGLG